MSADNRLCSRCGKIDFERLFFIPHHGDESEDDSELETTVSYGPLSNVFWSRYKNIRIGSIASVIKRRHSCDLCAFISKVACLVQVNLGRDLGSDLDSDSDIDSHSDSDTSDAETTSGRISPVSNAGEPEMLDTLRSPQNSDVPEVTASEAEIDGETVTLDIDGRTFELRLRHQGQSIICKLGREEFGKLRHVCWKGQHVDKLSICKLSVEFNYGASYSSTRLQVCVDKTGGGLPKNGTGREVPNLVDLGLVKGWIETCRLRHGDACEEPSWLDKVEPAPDLRVIDVVGKMIVPAAPGCRYLALSYVWGEKGLPKAAKALKSNIGKLGEEGGLACMALPRTIRDAIELTERLGERYLWVDALCIVQDDMEDLQRQTAAMDSVFSGAALTIAAAAGYDADAGLPGLTTGSRPNTLRKIRLTKEFSLLSTAEHEIGESEWKRRGWTYQERLLSRRVLFFTQHLVSWKCDHDTWNEETILETDGIEGDFGFPGNGLEPVSQIRDRFALRHLAHYIGDYTNRKLSYGFDILPAFQGVMRRYESVSGERLHWGLPYRIVDMGNSLMWRPILPGGERQDLRKLRLDDGTTISIPYPSWSWMRWKGPVDACWTLYSGGPPKSLRPELDFYKLMSDGRVELLTFREPPIPAGIPDETAAPFTQPMTRQWKGPTAISGPVLTGPSDRGLIQEVVPALPGTGADTSGAIPVYDTGRLVFWTSHARIRSWPVADRTDPDDFELHLQLPSRVARASDWRDMTCYQGRLYYMDPNTSRRLFGPSHATCERGDGATSRLLSYVVVSKNHADDPGEEDDLKVIPFNQPSEENPGFALLNALIVEWVDEEKGIARRIGTAVFLEPDWMALDREWKRVILE